MKVFRQLVVMLVVVALSAGAYAVMFVNHGDIAVGQGQENAFSLAGAALLFGSALLVLGNTGHRKNR